MSFRVTMYTDYDKYWVGEASRLIMQPGKPDFRTTPRTGAVSSHVYIRKKTIAYSF